MSFTSLGWPRPGQMDQGLTSVPLSAGDTVHILQLTLEEQTAPQPTPERNCSVWSMGPGLRRLPGLPSPLPAFRSVYCRARGVPKPSSPSGLCQKFASQSPKGPTLLGFVWNYGAENSLNWICLHPALFALSLCLCLSLWEWK